MNIEIFRSNCGMIFAVKEEKNSLYTIYIESSSCALYRDMKEEDKNEFLDIWNCSKLFI